MWITKGVSLVFEPTSSVRIPVRVVDGEIKPYYGTRFPAISNGAFGTLVIETVWIPDGSFIDSIRATERSVLLPARSVLMCAISTGQPSKAPGKFKGVPKMLLTSVMKIKTYPGIPVSCVKIVLEEPLELETGHARKPRLMPVRCHIPSLRRTASSLNNAYTIVSRAFEPWRTTHTGNVFRKLYFRRNNDYWSPLDQLRVAKESEAEERLFFDEKLFELTCDWHAKASYLNASDRELVQRLIEAGQLRGKDIKSYCSNDQSVYTPMLHRLLDAGVITEILDPALELDLAVRGRIGY